MLLDRVKRNLGVRFSPINANLSHLAQGNLESDINKIYRGLFYVHLYSGLEKTTNEIVERVLLIIDSFNIEHDHYIPVFNTISLNSQLMSYKSAAKDTAWLKANNIFGTMCSSQTVSINNTYFSSGLQNVWFETIQNLLQCFGIAHIEDTNKAMQIALDEIVDNRNAVAHGRIPAHVIGERHRPDVLRDRTEIAMQLMGLLTAKFESYILNMEFIKPKHHQKYLPQLERLTAQ